LFDARRIANDRVSGAASYSASRLCDWQAARRIDRMGAELARVARRWLDLQLSFGCAHRVERVVDQYAARSSNRRIELSVRSMSGPIDARVPTGSTERDHVQGRSQVVSDHRPRRVVDAFASLACSADARSRARASRSRLARADANADTKENSEVERVVTPADV